MNLASSIRINEIMPHTSNFLGQEWVELYNPEDEDLEFAGKIGDKVSNDSINFIIAGKSFFIIAKNCSMTSNCLEISSIGSGLNDEQENVYLYENDSLLTFFSWNTNLKSSGKSWQFIGGEWKDCLPSFNSENFCNTASQEKTDEKIAEKLMIKLEYNNEIECNKEAEVELNLYNLKDIDYDAKIYIENAKSEIYDGGWKSGNYYVNAAINGESSKKFKIKAKENGNKIIAKIRETGKTSIAAEYSGSIEINCDESELDEENETENFSGEAPSENELKEEAIYLQGKDIKTQKIAVYESKNKIIKQYAIIGFSGFCILVLILIILKKHDKSDDYN
jgi:hypothetical protein